MDGVRTLPASGLSLYVEAQGEGASLLCVHGLGGGAYFFTALGLALKKSARTVAFDLPGHGFSPCDPRGFSFERLAAAVVELACAEPARPATLLGHSLGVIVALKAYALAPELFDGLICVGGLPEPGAESRARLLERAAFVRTRGTLAGLGESILPFLIAPEALRVNPGMLGPMRRLVEINAAGAYADTCEALAGASAADLVPAVRVPCHLIVGSADAYAPPAAMRAFAETLPCRPTVFEFPRCGHFPFFEKPVEFHAAVKGFIED